MKITNKMGFFFIDLKYLITYRNIRTVMEYFNKRTLWFLLEKVHNASDILSSERFSLYDQESIKMFIDTVIELSDRVLYPVFKEMDEVPAYFENGKVIVHNAVREYLKKAGELGIIGGTLDEGTGGSQMPWIYYHAAVFILEAANNHLPGYGGLTAGSANLIAEFGSDELKKTFLPKMIEGKWPGTMCLTEPQAGSSLSDIITSATLQKDGTYLITGQKIFISGGDNQFSTNIIHLVLARIEGAPSGTKGISLFVVPKNRVINDGLEYNHVETLSDFPKLGQRGYCTTHLGFGADGDCVGWLVGEPHKGLSYMFRMMNEARIAVGRGAVSISCAAYHASLRYANERAQGRRLSSTGEKDPDEEQTLIINHPDVRRMLLFQKAMYEGALSLILQASLYHDQMMTAESEEKETYLLLLEILTPIAKTYPSEKGIESVSAGLQVLGGYGYSSDYILQQYYRDIRISSIYEGTTGIQSLDLLGRKITMENGKAYQLLRKEMINTVQSGIQSSLTKDFARQLQSKIETCDKVIAYLIEKAKKGDFESFLANATLFMELFGTLVIGWQWLKIGNAAISGDDNFEKSKVLTMRFFFIHELPKIDALATTLLTDDGTTIPGKEPVEF